MSYGLIVSKEGFNPDAEEKNLIFTSERAVPKIIMQGAVNINHTNQSAHTIVTHNLGYFPAYRLYFEYPAGSGIMWGDINAVPSTPDAWHTRVSTSTLQVVPLFPDFMTDGTYRTYYILFADPAKTTTVKLTPEEDQIGLAITKPGKDPSSDDLKDFVFHSSYAVPNIVKIVTLTTTTSNQTVSVDHDLPFRPAWAATATFSSGGTVVEIPYMAFGNFHYGVGVDEDKVYARTTTIASPEDVIYKVMLFNLPI